jgi:phage repressor protein C with HTH and peptisase S24 domain
MNNIIDRLEIFMADSGLNDNQLTVKAGLSIGLIGNARKVRKGLHSDTIEKILHAFKKLNAQWFMLGEGDIYNNTPEYEIKAQTVQIYEPKHEYEISTGGKVIPIIAETNITTGSGTFNNDNIDFCESIQLPNRLLKNKDANYAALQVKGDSMSPTLQDSSYVVSRLLTKNEWINMPDEQIFIVTDINGKPVITRVKNQLQQGFITLMSDNPDKNSFPNYNMDINEIINIWHVERYISAKMPDIHDQYYNRLQRLEDKYEDLEKLLNKHLPKSKL